MSAFTDIRCVLTQKAFDIFCDKFHIPKEAHLVLPNQNDTMHVRPTRKIEIDIFSFIHATDPTKVKIVERERNEDEPLLLETTIGRTVPLLLVAPDRAESGGGGADIQPVSEPVDTVVENVAPLQLRRQRKRKTVVVDAGESSHPPKRLREDHGTPSGTSVGGKSMSTVQRMLAGAVLNTEVRVAAIPTLPFVTAFVSTTPKHEVFPFAINSKSYVD
ncbi:hypothetical protein Tco_1348104 [Tanacetum coccineum]